MVVNSFIRLFSFLPHENSSQIDLQLTVLGWVGPLLNS